MSGRCISEVWRCSSRRSAGHWGAVLEMDSHTDLCVHELSQGSNELRCRIQIVCEESIVDELAN